MRKLISKVVLLAPGNSIHTIKWANGLASRGICVNLITMQEPNELINNDVKVHLLTVPAPLGYFLNARKVRQLCIEINPNIINVHFASGYGTLARLAQLPNIVLSVWGNDVYKFPHKSLLHRYMLITNLKHAKVIASTSHAMLGEVKKLFNPKESFVTPFGVDTNVFKPSSERKKEDNVIRIGTVKTLLPKYGIDTLIEAFDLVLKNLRADFNQRLELHIVGEGKQENDLKALTSTLGLTDRVYFHGRIPNHEVPQMLSSFDIYAALSRDDSESFGVAIVEASACGLPVIVSDTDGPKEVTIHEETGYVCQRNNPQKAAENILKLVENESLRNEMGRKGLARVRECYDWNVCLDEMLSCYNLALSS